MEKRGGGIMQSEQEEEDWWWTFYYCRSVHGPTAWNGSRKTFQRRRQKKKKGGVERKKNLLADAEGHFEAPLQRSVLIETLKRLHAQVAMTSGGRSRRHGRWRPSTVAIAHKRIQVPTALSVCLALSQCPMTSTLIDGHGTTTTTTTVRRFVTWSGGKTKKRKSNKINFFTVETLFNLTYFYCMEMEIT